MAFVLTAVNCATLLKSWFRRLRRGIFLRKALIVPETPKSHSVTYADAGVDIPSGDRAKERIKFLAQKTFNRNVLGGIGGFGGLFRLDMQRWKSPVLVSSADETQPGPISVTPGPAMIRRAPMAAVVSTAILGPLRRTNLAPNR